MSVQVFQWVKGWDEIEMLGLGRGASHSMLVGADELSSRFSLSTWVGGTLRAS